ncbi:MAG: DUF6029 family protein [Candidatus Eisenbacteria bacterium]
MPTDRFLPTVCLVIVIAAVSVVWTSPVGALETGARGAVSGEGLLNTDEGARVVDARVDFDIDVDFLTFGGAYRFYDFGNKNYNPAGIDAVDHLKHRYLAGEIRGLFFRAGHFFSTFGRGLTLRSFEDPGLEHDTSLDGIIAEYETGPVRVTGLTGMITERLTGLQSREHNVRGGRARAGVGDILAVAVSGLDRSTKRRDEQVVLPDSLTSFSDNVIGAEVEVWHGPLSLVGEYARRDGDYYHGLEQDGEGGSATYLSGSLATNLLTLLGEYKDYDRFENTLVNPPICVKEHVWILMNRVTHQVSFDNERGFLLEGTLSASENVQLTGGASEARTQGGSLGHWEIFGQVDQPLPGWGIRSFAGSWSREYLYGKFTENISCGLDLEISLPSQHVVEVGIEAQTIKEPSLDSHENYMASAALYPWPSVTLAATGELTTEEGLERDKWLFGEARVSVGGDFEVSLGAGSERGGKKCSGGICYTEPEFAGVRLRFSAFF